MITGIGATGGRPLDQLRNGGVERKTVPAATTADEATNSAPVSAAKEMADAGAPVDLDKVARIKAGIADGSYRADPQAIATKMIALDLPGKA